MEEELRYTERKLAAALGQLRDTDTGTNTDQEGRRAALVLALGTGLPYQVHLQNLDPDWLGPEDMALLRRYGGQGFYDAGHLARRLSALLDGDPHSDQTSPQTPPQTLPPALDWLTRNAGALVEVRPQSLAQVADAQHDILKALMAGRPDAALRLVDEMLVGTPDTPSALRAWRNDLALWRTMAPVMAACARLTPAPPRANRNSNHATLSFDIILIGGSECPGRDGGRVRGTFARNTDGV